MVVVGYGGLGRSCGPSLTCGVLSKAISLKYQPIMLQTTCAVQAGASGGAVVRPSTGELLGKKPTQHHILLLISGGHMMTTEKWNNAPYVRRDKAATHARLFSLSRSLHCCLCSFNNNFLFCRYRVQQHEGLGCKSDLSTPQLQHPSDCFPQIAAAL